MSVCVFRAVCACSAARWGGGARDRHFMWVYELMWQTHHTQFRNMALVFLVPYNGSTNNNHCHSSQISIAYRARERERERDNKKKRLHSIAYLGEYVQQNRLLDIVRLKSQWQMLNYFEFRIDASVCVCGCVFGGFPIRYSCILNAWSLLQLLCFSTNYTHTWHDVINIIIAVIITELTNEWKWALFEINDDKEIQWASARSNEQTNTWAMCRFHLKHIDTTRKHKNDTLKITHIIRQFIQKHMHAACKTVCTSWTEGDRERERELVPNTLGIECLWISY